MCYYNTYIYQVICNYQNFGLNKVNTTIYKFNSNYKDFSIEMLHTVAKMINLNKLLKNRIFKSTWVGITIAKILEKAGLLFLRKMNLQWYLWKAQLKELLSEWGLSSAQNCLSIFHRSHCKFQTLSSFNSSIANQLFLIFCNSNTIHIRLINTKTVYSVFHKFV